MKLLLKLEKESHHSEYEETTEPNGTKRIKIKGMRSQDIARILTPSNFKKMNHELEGHNEYAHEEARELLFDFQCTSKFTTFLGGHNEYALEEARELLFDFQCTSKFTTFFKRSKVFVRNSMVFLLLINRQRNQHQMNPQNQSNPQNLYHGKQTPKINGPAFKRTILNDHYLIQKDYLRTIKCLFRFLYLYIL